MCGNNDVLTRRFDTTDSVNGYQLIEPGPWQAIAIGPDSDFDRCTIVAKTQGVVPIQVAGGLAGSIDRQVDIGDAAFSVSVERPFIGRVEGPLRVLLPYAKGIYGSQRLRPDNRALYQGFAGRPTFLPRLELQLYSFLPPWLPTKRAPFELPFRFPEFGTTGESAVDLYLPGFGRRSLTLSLRMGGYTAGQFAWRFTGRNSLELHDGTAIATITHDLQALTTETANFDRTYAFDGEFDLYHLGMGEGSALSAGTFIEGSIKAWD